MVRVGVHHTHAPLYGYFLCVIQVIYWPQGTGFSVVEEPSYLLFVELGVT